MVTGNMSQSNAGVRHSLPRGLHQLWCTANLFEREFDNCDRDEQTASLLKEPNGTFSLI